MMPSADEFLQRHDGGIHAIDTGFHRARFDASYLLVQRGRGAFVDTGYGPDPQCDVNFSTNSGQ